MDILRQHEIFEIEVLNKLNSAKMFIPLVFGGDTMLRLCHGLSRYSAGLDFWIIKKISHQAFFNKISETLEADYEITDQQMKHRTLLFELRSAAYPKRLKIEIRREMKDADFQEKIAYTKFSPHQVVLKAHTLEQTMKNKIAAFLNRNEIRDCFDIEFLLRRGIALSFMDRQTTLAFQQKLSRFKDMDFKVKLGAILEKEMRDYYTKNRFSFLKEKLTEMIQGGK